jgi:hypothetical protein
MLTYAARMRGEFGTVPRILRIRGLSLNSRYNEEGVACDAGVDRDD